MLYVKILPKEFVVKIYNVFSTIPMLTNLNNMYEGVQTFGCKFYLPNKCSIICMTMTMFLDKCVAMFSRRVFTP